MSLNQGFGGKLGNPAGGLGTMNINKQSMIWGKTGKFWEENETERGFRGVFVLKTSAGKSSSGVGNPECQ